MDLSQHHTLAGIALFRQLPRDERVALEKRCSWATYPAGTQLIGHLDDSHSVYFLTYGEARVKIYSESGKEVSFRDIGSGEFFGEYSAIDGEPRSASVEALTPCCAARMAPDLFLDILSHEATAADAMIHHLVRQVRGLTKRVYEFSTLAVQNRIHAELLRLARDHAVANGTARLDPAPTHADIASRISTHREAVTRELSRLAKLGLVEQKGRSLTIKDLDRLERMVADASGE